MLQTTPQSNILQSNMKQILSLFVATVTVLVLSFTMAFAGQPSGWQNQEIKVKGAWSIEQRADGNYLILDNAFKTKNAPDLKFFLSKKGYSSINGNNAANDAVLISQLKSAKGGQEYKIPSNINLADYSSLVLHCEQYSKLWASTPLK